MLLIYKRILLIIQPFISLSFIQLYGSLWKISPCFQSQQEDECEENFRKSCFIEYEKIAFDKTIAVCRPPLVKDCDIKGPEICITEFESECWTKQQLHDVEDDVVECKTELEEKCEDETLGYTTNTKCSKLPKEVCSISKKYTPINGCTKPKLLSWMPLRESVLLSHSVPASMWPNLYPAYSYWRVCWCPRGGLHQVNNHPEKVKNQWSRNGVMCHQRNPDLPKWRQF